jgi:peptidoglycan hydrolase CwlO-like protein
VLRGSRPQRPHHRIAAAAVLAASLAALLAIVAAPAGATGQLQSKRAQARDLAAQVSALDARIGVAVTRYAQATQALDAVRAKIGDTERLQRVARLELDVARSTLMARAVSLYKHGDVTMLDAVFGADDFGALVDQLDMARRIARSDRDVLRTIVVTQKALARRGQQLAADERTARKLVDQRSSELAVIRRQLDERRGLLAGVQAEIRALAAQQIAATPAPAATVEPPASGGAGGDGPWWPLIRQAAKAQGVSARGMYRLMMIESGGSATIVGPGGYYGLFQYAPTTWKGSWNPYRASAITDGAAQIKATALAINLGYRHAWWDPSFSWAFNGS